MKRFAVGYLNAFDNDLTVEIISSETWANAIKSHSKLNEFDLNHMDFDNLEKVKQAFFDLDSSIDVVEIV